MRNLIVRASLGLLLGLAGGCTADISSPGGANTVGPGFGPGGVGGNAGSSGAGPGPAPAGASAGLRPLQRLTRAAYERTVRDLLHLKEQPASGLPDDGRNLGYGFVEAGPVSEVDASALQTSAEALAKQALTAGLSNLMGCTPEGANEAICLDTFIRSFGRRAFRRPLTEQEVLDLKTLATTSRTDGLLSVQDSVRVLLEGILQAPQFLYQRERSTPDTVGAAGLERLTSDELASRLSYLMWRSMPDDALFAAVDAGTLSTPEDMAREAGRLLADPRSQDTLVDFVAQWFHLPLSDVGALRAAASAETEAFVRSVLSGDGRLDSLLLAPVNFVNETLAPIYGVDGITGTSVQKVSGDPAQRFGLLTQVNFLGTFADGAQSHPVKRGNIVFKQVLCGELPPIPDNVPPPGAEQQNVSNRKRFEAHSQNACARGCHAVLDPLGFAFEHYDGTGRYRDMDGGEPVDSSGTLTLPGAATAWTFQDAKQLVDLITTSGEARSCAAKQWLRYALTRRETDDDQASLNAEHAAFSAAGYDLRALFLSVASTPSFLYRTSTPPEGTFP